MLETGDIVQCTVERIERTIIFVKINTSEGEKEGSIVVSEISPGRIRNMRDFVVPKKKIICKILRISERGNVELSLRRVTPKEKKEILEQAKQEKSYKSVVKSVLKEKSDELFKKISKEDSIYNFFEQAKSDEKKLEKFISKEEAKKILEILNSQKQKKYTVKKEIRLNSNNPDGLNLIKKILSEIKDAEIKYISAGRYTIKTEGENIKTADNKAREIISEIDKEAKQKKVDFSIKEK